MKKAFKIMSLALVSALVVLTFAACGGKENNPYNGNKRKFPTV